ncbi:MAG: hypothetical protein GC168_19365 [Candidatus Hydrogenedens sp.]|nr:hypothetical protein [Candidatus Hydrogenedens sp.]
MGRPGPLTRLVAGALALTAFYAALQFFMGYADQGNELPYYSSRRSDPLGTRALYGAFERVDGLKVSRNNLPLTAWTPPPGATLIVQGAAVSPDPLNMIELTERWVNEGGRLVIAHYPYRDNMMLWYRFEEDETEGEADGEGEDAPPEPAADAEGETEGAEADEDERTSKERWADSVNGVWIDERWGFTYRVNDEVKDVRQAFSTVEYAQLPESVAWWSGLYFEEPDENWQVVFNCEDHPVIIERPWGQGSIVICSDTYFMSNEAMKKDRHPELLAWLAGDSDTIIFDEAHLGLEQAPGVAGLLRRFRFEGIVLAFIVCGALLAWQGMSSLLPRRDRVRDDDRHERGREATAGLEALLRRSVPRAGLLSQCLQEYEATLDPGSPKRSRAARARDLARHAESPGMTQEELVNTYRRIRAVLSERD